MVNMYYFLLNCKTKQQFESFETYLMLVKRSLTLVFHKMILMEVMYLYSSIVD